MNRQFIGKLKEALISVLPVTLIVILLNLTPLVDFSSKEIAVFSFSAFLLILGIGLFNLGADLAMTPMGEYVGSGLTKSKKLGLLLSVCFALGLFITIAEPDLTVLASQVEDVINPPSLIIISVGLGVGLFLVIAVLKLSEDGKVLKDGIKTVILGKPNVGKSSLLNALLEEEKAIVTDVKGTTRDIVEGSIIVGGVKLNLIDTAGVRESNDVVEKIGIEKSIKLIEEAELVLLVLDASEEISEEDKFLLDKTKYKKRIIIMNKEDLNKNNSYDKEVIKISAKNNTGIEDIKEKIKELFNVGAFLNKDLTFFTNVRQIALLKTAIEALEDVIKGANDGLEIDMIEIDLKLVWERLGDIIGANYTEELVDNLFSRFCLGK